MSDKPVIIIGAARSGTKFTRALVAAGQTYSAVPYDVNYVWRHGNHGHPHDALSPEAVAPDIGQYIRRVLTRMAGSPVFVEKTVSNTLRVPFVDAIFPGARYIHLIRNGRDVVESSYRMWHKPSEPGYLLDKLRYFPITDLPYAFWYVKNKLLARLRPGNHPAIWGVRYPGIESDLRRLGVAGVCARQWVESVRRAAAAFEHIDPARQLTIRYEELVSDSGTLDRIAEFLDQPDPDALRAYYHENLRSGTGGKWGKTFDSDTRALIMDIIGDTQEALGYPRPTGR